MRCSAARRLRRYKAMQRKNTEIKAIFIAVTVVFSAFLLIPAVRLLLKSFYEGGFTTAFYSEVLTQDDFGQALLNSFAVSGAAACLATVIAFALAYAIHYTGLPAGFKHALQGVATLPMFLPTITYGFAIIYSFGKQGLITRLLGFQLFDIYGFQGLLLGYVIYTVPVAFLLIHNTMGFIDKKTITVSKLMGDSPLATFRIAVLRPLLGTLAGAFLQSFFLCFTDFGIPASVGGRYEVIATVLYNQMLGAVPDFNKGAVVAMVMLLPSILSIALLQFLERFNIRYNRISAADLRRNPVRDRDGAVGRDPRHLRSDLCRADGGGVALSDRLHHRACDCGSAGQRAVHGIQEFAVRRPADRAVRHADRLRRSAYHRALHCAPLVQAGDRSDRTGDQYHPRHGARPRVFVQLFGHQPAEYLHADDRVQHHPLFLRAWSRPTRPPACSRCSATTLSTRWSRSPR